MIFHFFGSPHKLLSPGAGTFVLLPRGPVFRRGVRITLKNKEARVTSVTGLAALAARIDAALYRDEGMFGCISGIPE
jgi:hypothetical protein